MKEIKWTQESGKTQRVIVELVQEDGQPLMFALDNELVTKIAINNFHDLTVHIKTGDKETTYLGRFKGLKPVLSKGGAGAAKVPMAGKYSIERPDGKWLTSEGWQFQKMWYDMAAPVVSPVEEPSKPQSPPQPEPPKEQATEVKPPVEQTQQVGHGMPIPPVDRSKPSSTKIIIIAAVVLATLAISVAVYFFKFRSNTPVPSPTPTVAPSPTPAASAAPSPSPTLTPSPTMTPVPTQAPSPAPSPSPPATTTSRLSKKEQAIQDLIDKYKSPVHNGR
ncbi:MAG: hypothetical protein H7844_11930 [Nitrospirae bacterium YQR-1]